MGEGYWGALEHLSQGGFLKKALLVAFNLVPRTADCVTLCVCVCCVRVVSIITKLPICTTRGRDPSLELMGVRERVSVAVIFLACIVEICLTV